MFDSLEEKIEEVDGAVPSRASQLLRYLGCAVLAAVVIGGLYLAIRLL